jgi:hypothetical protein
MRTRRRRRTGYGLVAFGASGLILAIIAAVLVLGTLGAIGDAATGFERQRAEVLAMLEPAAAALSDAGDSAGHAGASLTEASDAARRGADLTSRLATSFESMAGLGSFEIFGTRPFAGMSSQFSDVATQSRALASDLSSTADALATNVTDSQSVATDLHSLADRLRQLETTVQPSSASSTPSAVAIALAQVVLLGLLAWIGILAVASIWLGLRLARDEPLGLDLEG